MARRAEALEDLPEGTKTAFEWTPRPPSVALDLAIQAAGLVSVPVTDPEEGARRGATAWTDQGGGSSPLGGRGLGMGGGQEGGVSGAVVIGEKDAVLLSSDELITAGARIQQALAPGKGREIAVLGGSPELWPNRALFAWATVYGAALVLAPTPDSLVSSAVWARPTLFLGTAAEVAALRRALERERPPFWARKGGRLTFGRLRTVIWSAAEAPSGTDLQFWERRGVRVAESPFNSL